MGIAATAVFRAEASFFRWVQQGRKQSMRDPYNSPTNVVQPLFPVHTYHQKQGLSTEHDKTKDANAHVESTQ